MHQSFNLYQKTLKSGKKVWYVRLWDESAGKWGRTRSTRVCATGKKGGFHEASLKAEEMASGLAGGGGNGNKLLVPFLLSFWQEDSLYPKEKSLVDGEPLSAKYIRDSWRAIKNHVLPYPRWKNKKVGALLPRDVREWQVWCMEGGCGAVVCNFTFKAMSAAYSWLESRGDIASSPFRKMRKVREKRREKGVLTKQEVAAVLGTEYRDLRISLMVRFSVLTGARLGECRGLRWGDIDETLSCVHLVHNYVDGEGERPCCKWNSNRMCPFPAVLRDDFIRLRKTSPHPGADDYVFYSVTVTDGSVPLSWTVVRRGFRNYLAAAGISREEQRERNISFHSFRHTFITLARSVGISDAAVMAMAGHRSVEMLAHYSHVGKILDFRELSERLGKMGQKEEKNS